MKFSFCILFTLAIFFSNITKAWSSDDVIEAAEIVCGFTQYTNCMGLTKDDCVSHYIKAYQDCPKRYYKEIDKEVADGLCITNKFILNTNVSQETAIKCDSIMETEIDRLKRKILPNKAISADAKSRAAE